jgi:hypothetical protein
MASRLHACPVPGFCMANMYSRLSVALFSATLVASSHALAGDSPDGVPAPAPAVFAVTGLRAYLFYEPLGRMDERDLVVGPFALWNAMIGAGDATAPSNTTIVLVDVTGPAFVTGTKGTLSFVATMGKQILRRETVKLNEFFSEGTRLSIPFVVVGTGCGTLKITATLIVPGRRDRLLKTVEFGCGE